MYFRGEGVKFKQMHKKRIIKAIVALGISVAGWVIASAQPMERSFQVALPLGANLAQVAGDPYSGLRKWGLTAGVEGIAPLPGNKQLSVGMFFQQLGAVPSITERKQSEQNYIEMRLSYIEVPLLLFLPLQQGSTAHRIDAELGFSFARQLSSRVVRSTTVSSGGAGRIPYMNIVDQQSAFQNFVWNGIGGLSYYLYPQVALRLRYHHSMSTFFKPDSTDEGLKALRHRYLSMAVRYIIL